MPNVYGPHISGGVVRRFIEDEKLSRPGTENPKGISIHGDGTQTRDFLYEGDMVKAIIEGQTWEPGEYYIGTGIQTSVFEVFRQLTYIWGYTPKRDFIPMPNDTLQILPFIESSGLPWAAKPLEEGLRLTVQG